MPTPPLTWDQMREAGEAVSQYGTVTEAAKATGIARSTLDHRYQQWRRKVRQGYSPEHGMNHAAPDPLAFDRTSVYFRATEDTPAQWVRFKRDDLLLKQSMEQALEAMTESLPPLPVPKFKARNYDTDVIPWLQIGDAHIGMLAYKYEVGHNFDLEIAEAELLAGAEKLINDTPACERCVINDLGDATHAENVAGETEASRHRLDMDGRFNRMVAVYVRTMRRIVDMALARFKYVDVIINQGNHSRTNDLWMPHLLRAAYPTDRLHVLDNSSVFIPYRMGNTFVLTHHTDKCKPEKLAGVMAEDFRHDWGESKYRYIDGGHIHHKRRCIELTGAIYESWNQMAPSDKYAHDGGWRSRSFLQIVDRSRTYGEVGRRTVPVEMVQDMLAKLPAGTSVANRREVYSV